MNRNPLLKLLSVYQISFPEEETAGKTEQFVRENRRCFERGLPSGHITGSA